jgi:hypothetical protein
MPIYECACKDCKDVNGEKKHGGFAVAAPKKS